MRKFLTVLVLLVINGRSLEATSHSFSCGVVSHALPKHLVAPTSRFSTTGLKKLIFYRVRFPDDKADPVSVAEAEETLAEVNIILLRISKGRFQLESTISPVLFLANGRQTYSSPDGFNRFLDDVRAAGFAAGYDFEKYDLDIARHSGVPGFMGGNANLGTRGAQVQAPGAVLIVHELGHNFGLNHANLWVTGSPGIVTGSPPLPSNFPGTPDPRSIPVYPDSFLGHESIVGPGTSSEYGDVYDIMGSGTEEFGAAYRHVLGWLNDDEIAVAASGLTMHTIQGTEGTVESPELPRAIRVARLVQTPLGEKEYWIQLPALSTNRTIFPGIHVRWADPTEGHSGSQIIAPSASSPGIDSGVMLKPGKTFSHSAAGVHITLVELSGEGDSRKAGVAVFAGNDLSNQPPAVNLHGALARIMANESITLGATATDPNGDGLVWHWDFGDGTFSTERTNVTKAWRRDGDFLVSVEVSDMKGGIARAQIAITVGDRTAWRVSGRVLTEDGQPVQGARVHNGAIDAGTSFNRYLQTFTDSAGAYTLTAVPSGTYDLGAFLFGYTVQRRSPITVTGQDLSDIDFVARELPKISVAAPAEISEATGLTNLFALTRSAPTDGPLTVLYRLGGSAVGGRDYVRPLIDRVTIPAGQTTAHVNLDIQDDGIGEEDETITLEISYPVQEQRVDLLGQPYTVYFPGWEFAVIEGQTNWIQTDPAYIPAASSTVAVIIKDNDQSAPKATVTVTADSTIAIENPMVSSAFYLTRSGDISNALVVPLSFLGSAQGGTDYNLVLSIVAFEPGETDKSLIIQPVADGIPEPEEEVIVQIIPGDDYAIETGSASIRIRDNSDVPLTVSATQQADGQVRIIMKARPASRLVLETSSDFTQWLPIRTNFLFNSDTATVTVPKADTNSFFRTVIAKP